MLRSSPWSVSALHEQHLFRLVYRKHRDERPVDWEAVLDRLQQAPEETRLWVKTDYCPSRLFLHELCDQRFDEDEEGLSNVLSTVFRKTIEAYPVALHRPDGHGYYPLHVLCRRHYYYVYTFSNLGWHRGDKEVFRMLVRAAADVARLVTDVIGRSPSSFIHRTTALHLLLEVDGDVDSVQELLELFPEALRIADEAGCYPLHIVCSSIHPIETLKLVLCRYPQAAEIRTRVGGQSYRTPLLTLIRELWYDIAGFIDHAQLLIRTCPQSLFIQDETRLNLWYMSSEDWCIEPAGDALDYLICRYCQDAIHVPFGSARYVENVHIDDNEYGDYPNYVQANLDFLNDENFGDRVTDDGFVLILSALHFMSGHGERLPLHAFVQGRLCRPWHLVMLKEMLYRYSNSIRERDEDGNLPLHLFLESCMIEQQRALDRLYVKDLDEYNASVVRCIKILLDAEPSTVTDLNGDGRSPLHLAIENCPAAVVQLLDRWPADLLTRQDKKTQLFPFLIAAVGSSSNLDLVYLLLRKEPQAALELSSLRAA